MDVNLELLKEFESTINTIEPEKGEIPIKILGYGEISLVFEILDDPLHNAYKRIPIFDSEKQVKRHIWAFNTYNKLLQDNLGILLPEQKAIWFKDKEGRIQFYIIQKKVNSEAVGNQVIHHISDQEVETLILLAMRELKKVWVSNKENENLEIGIDGQISNFVVLDYDFNNPKINENNKLLYLDTSTPMFRKNGAEGMEAELFLKSTPSFLRFLIKAFFLQEVLDRYYDWRLVTIDLIANFFKEQKPEIIPRLIGRVNRFFREEAADFSIKPITLDEIQKYYKSDKTIWLVFQNARRIDRFIKTKLLRKNYEYYLPGKIER
ncbi:MAG: DUF6206 family protein [Candidatus Thorarchaeota archaeon]